MSEFPWPLFQSESKCDTILMKMTLICMEMNLHAEIISISIFHIGFSLRLVLKQRHKRTRMNLPSLLFIFFIHISTIEAILATMNRTREQRKLYWS